MAGFTDQALMQKFSELNNSANSIQQLSIWLIHHRKHFQTIVKTWFKELIRVNKDRKLTFMYLANDVVQNAKKKHPEYPKEFGVHMKKVFEHLAAINFDEKTIKSIGRLINIWSDRQIFDDKRQKEMSFLWQNKAGMAAAAKKRPGTPPDPPPQAKVLKDEKTPIKEEKSPIKTPNSTERRKSKPLNERLSESKIGDLDQQDEDEELFDDVTNLSPNQAGSPGSGDPPEPEELIKALQELENSASSDAVVREKIARLPPEVSEVAHLGKLESSQEGQRLLVQVEEATQLLDGYNERLQAELQDRKKVGKMVSEFLSAQRDLLAQAEERLEIYRDKLDKINNVKDELKSHIAALPDLSQLPNVTDGLAPLPSAGDLFTIR